MKKFFFLIIVFLFISDFYLYSQDTLDKVETRNIYDEDDNLVKRSETLFGKVISIEIQSVRFKLQRTELIMEIAKSDIKKLTLATGQVMTFAPDKEKVKETDSGGIGTWGVIGIVLTVLIVLGLVINLAN